MKVFISWSGELSQKVAQILSDWLPSINNSIKPFFSSDDIEKGEEWSVRIKNELSETCFGIICLTKKNSQAPWINFEAGAIAKELNSRVATFLVDVKPSDIKGPISRYQATRFDRDDFYHLILSINECSDDKLDENRLKKNFELVWDKIEKEIAQVIKEFSAEINKVDRYSRSDETMQEILQIVRSIDANNRYTQNEKNAEAEAKAMAEISKLNQLAKQLEQDIDKYKSDVLTANPVDPNNKTLKNSQTEKGVEIWLKN